MTQRSEQADRVLDLAREEAERCGHRYLGPEHVLLGVLAEGHSRAAQLLRSHGLAMAATRAVGEATWRVTRRRRWRGRRVVWTPLCGPPLVAKRVQPLDPVGGSRRHRQILAHVGLSDGHQGAAGLLLAALEVDPDRPRDAVAAELGGIRP